MFGIDINIVNFGSWDLIALYLFAFLVLGFFDWVGSAITGVAGWVSGAASTVGSWVGSAVSTVTSIIGKAGSEIGMAVGTAIGGPVGAGIGKAVGGALESVFSKTKAAEAEGRTLTPSEIRAEIETQLPFSFSSTEAQATIAAIQANPDIPPEVKTVIYEVIHERTVKPTYPDEKKPGGCAAKEAFGG